MDRAAFPHAPFVFDCLMKLFFSEFQSYESQLVPFHLKLCHLSLIDWVNAGQEREDLCSC